MTKRILLYSLLLAALSLQAEATEVAFKLVDEWTVMGIPTARWRPIKLAAEPQEELSAIPEFAGEARYGALQLGQGEDNTVTVVLDYSETESVLFVDANNDERIERAERCPAASGVWEARLIPPGQQNTRRLRFKLGVAGRILLYAVRGNRLGKLPTKLGLRPVVLLDMNGDCVYDTGGCDQLCCDLDEDGKFTPIAERVALLPSVHIGDEEFVLKVSSSGDTLDVDLRDRQLGRLVVTVALKEGEVTSALITLTRDDGLPLAVRETGKPVELPEGTYRLAGADVWVTDEADQAWHFPFEFVGGKGLEVKVERDVQTDVAFLASVECRLDISGELAAGERLSVTVNCITAEGLKLGAASKGQGRGEVISAKAWLIGPEGQVLAHDDAGFG